MPGEMTEERLAELPDTELAEMVDLEIQGLLTDFYGPPPVVGPPWADQLLVEYRRRLAAAKAENERLREVLRDIAYNTSTSIPFAAPPETYIVGQLRSCIGRAARVLNPETAP